MVLSRDIVEKHKQQLELLLNLSLQALAEVTDLVSEVGQQKIKVTLDSMDLVSIDGVKESLSIHGPEMVYVSQRITSSYASDLLFLMPELKSVAFMNAITREENKPSRLTESKKEAFVDIGNIILNCFLRHFSQKFQEPVNSHIPSFNLANYETLLQGIVSETRNSGLFYLQLNIKMIDQVFPGYILWTDPGNLY